jgi:hypothetical protein
MQLGSYFNIGTTYVLNALSMFLYFDPKSTLFVVVVEFVSAFRDSTDLGLLYQLSFKDNL